MTKTKTKTRIWAFLLALITVLVTVPVTALPAKAADPVDPTTDYTVKETVYHEDFSTAFAKGALPAGWTTQSICGWWTAASTALAGGTRPTADAPGTKVDGSKIYHKEISGTKGIMFDNVAGGDFMLVLPGATDGDGNALLDYKYSFRVRFVGTGGSMGPITSMSSNYKDMNKFVMYTGKDTTTMDGGAHAGQAMSCSGYYCHLNKIKDDDHFVFWDDAPFHFENGTQTAPDYTFTTYYHSGVSYFYINGEFFAKLEDGDTDPADAVRNLAGLFLCGGSYFVSDVKIESFTDSRTAKQPAKSDSALSVRGTDIRYTDAEGNITGDASMGLRFETVIDKTSSFYKNAANATFGALILPVDLLPEGEELTVNTPDVLDIPSEKVFYQDDKSLVYKSTVLNIPKAARNDAYLVRAYAKVGNEYTYSPNNNKWACPAQVANYTYEDNDNTALRARLDELFQGCESYQGANMKKITISLFSDMHYKKGMYPASVTDLNAIMDRANASNADLVLHCGDMCNDYGGSPELFRAYLNNKYNLPVYGLYGNHELEASGNSMQVVTPLLTNQKDQVVWGTADGKIGDGSIAYYYFENSGFRFIMLDSNYSWNPTKQVWEHNTTASWGPPDGNTKVNSLGPQQMEWLKAVLADAAEKKIPCILATHAGFTSSWPDASTDADAIVALIDETNQKDPGTVIAVLNGHKHAHYARVSNGVFYINTNAVRNTHWQSQAAPHYENETYMQEIFDAEYNIIGYNEVPLSSLWMSPNSWYCEEPLNAVLTISTSGKVTLDGCESSWWAGIAPNTTDLRMPYIPDGVYNLND